MFEKLYDKWKGDKALINKVVEVLSGPLHANNSFLISEQFLSPLFNAGHIDKDFSLDLWQEVFLNKIKYRDAYIVKSSSNDMEGFSINTDQELTHTLINLIASADSIKQEKIVKEWIVAIHPIFAVINQPFIRFVNYHTYSESGDRIYWLQFILNTLLQHNLLSEPSKKSANDFLEEHAKDIQSVNKFIDNLGYSQLRLLKFESLTQLPTLQII